MPANVWLRRANKVGVQRNEPLYNTPLSPQGRGAGGEGPQIAPCQDNPGFCRSVTLAEIAQHGYVLAPGRYVVAEAVKGDDKAFTEKMQRLTQQLGEQNGEGRGTRSVDPAEARRAGV